jgi:predicted ATPase
MSQGRVQRSRLLGRQTECEALDRLVTDALAGESRVIVLRGEAGVGKSALLQHLSDRAAGWLSRRLALTCALRAVRTSSEKISGRP